VFPTVAPPRTAILINRGNCYALTAQSGTIAAALAQNSILFALRAPAADGRSIYVDRLSLAFTTIAAFTTPITAGRRLGLFRATNGGTEVSGGTDVSTSIVARDSDASVVASVASLARIATTTGLTAGGLTLAAAPFATLDLVSSGAAGARVEHTYEMSPAHSSEQCVNPGEYIVIANPVAMDAGGTWQIAINELTWFEKSRGGMVLQ
jgi:hypothetical protein